MSKITLILKHININSASLTIIPTVKYAVNITRIIKTKVSNTLGARVINNSQCGFSFLYSV